MTSAPRHMTQSNALEEFPAPGALNLSVNIIGLILAAFIGWAAFAKVQEVAIAQGQIVPSGHIQTIQHLEGGIIREILVEDGQMVEKGDELVKFDDTNANADLGQMLERKKSLELQAARLRSFATSTASAAELTPDEQAILTSMEEARSSQQKVLTDQIAQKEKELQGIIASRTSLQRNLDLAREEYSINQKLATRGSVSRVGVMAIERQVNALQGELETSISQENQAKAALDEAKNRLQSLGADLKQEAMKNLGQVEAELSELNKSITKLQSASNRTVVTSPVRGIVKGLATNTIGSVIEPGKVLMEIVPIDEAMVVEAMVSPTDIGNLKQGQKVNVKVTAFDFSRFGTIEGTLDTISASTFQDQQGKTFYKAKIHLLKNYVGQDPHKNMILPGMVVQADIVTGEKTILQYLLKPIHTATQTAFQEK